MGFHFGVQKELACTSNATKTRLPVPNAVISITVSDE